MADKTAPGVRRSRARATKYEKPTAAQNAAEQTTLKKAAFLAAYAACGSRTKAAAAVSIDRTTHYVWMREDEEYKKQFDALSEEVLGILEDEALRRSVDGVERVEIGRVARDTDGPLLFKDGSPIIRREYSDKLLEILLKANAPHKYRERVDVTGANGGPIETHELTEAERAARIAAILDTARARGTGHAATESTAVGTPSGSADTSSKD